MSADVKEGLNWLLAMLQLYPFTIETLGEIHPLIEAIARKDSDLAKQTRRASSSIALNIAEDAYAQGRHAKSRFYTTMASANEVRACLAELIDEAPMLSTTSR